MRLFSILKHCKNLNTQRWTDSGIKKFVHRFRRIILKYCCDIIKTSQLNNRKQVLLDVLRSIDAREILLKVNLKTQTESNSVNKVVIAYCSVKSAIIFSKMVPSHRAPSESGRPTNWIAIVVFGITIRLFPLQIFAIIQKRFSTILSGLVTAHPSLLALVECYLNTMAWFAIYLR